MKRTSLLLLSTLLFISTLTFAQEKDEDEPLPPPKRSGTTKIGGAAGFTQGLLFLNMDPINEIMRRENLAEFSNNGLVMFGGQGYAYVMFVPNLRIGYMGMSGHMLSKTLALSSNATREVELSVGYSGLSLDYTIPLVPRLDLTVGVLFGGGSMDLKFTRSYGMGQEWLRTWDDFGFSNPAGEYQGKLTGSFFVYQPSVNFEFSLLRWVGLRAGLTYLGMSGSDWKRDQKYDVYGVPDNVSGKGWMLHSGIFVGTFVF